MCQRFLEIQHGRTGINTTIRRIAVRETYASRHHVAQLFSLLHASYFYRDNNPFGYVLITRSASYYPEKILSNLPIHPDWENKHFCCPRDWPLSKISGGGRRGAQLNPSIPQCHGLSSTWVPPREAPISQTGRINVFVVFCRCFQFIIYRSSTLAWYAWLSPRLLAYMKLSCCETSTIIVFLIYVVAEQV